MAVAIKCRYCRSDLSGESHPQSLGCTRPEDSHRSRHQHRLRCRPRVPRQLPKRRVLLYLLSRAHKLSRVRSVESQSYSLQGNASIAESFLMVRCPATLHRLGRATKGFCPCFFCTSFSECLAYTLSTPVASYRGILYLVMDVAACVGFGVGAPTFLILAVCLVDRPRPNLAGHTERRRRTTNIEMGVKGVGDAGEGGRRGTPHATECHSGTSLISGLLTPIPRCPVFDSCLRYGSRRSAARTRPSGRSVQKRPWRRLR